MADSKTEELHAQRQQEVEDGLDKLRAETEAELAKEAEGTSDDQPSGEEPESESAPEEQSPSKESEGDEDDTQGDGSDEDKKPDEDKDEGGGQLSDDDTPDDVKALRPKARKRFKKLNERAKQAEEYEKLYGPLPSRDGAAPQQAPVPPQQAQAQPYQFPWSTRPPQQPRTADPQVEQLRNQVAEMQANKVYEEYHSDMEWMEEKYPELNEDNPDFDEDLTTFLASQYLAARQADKDLRLKDYVAKAMKVIEQQRKEGSEQASSRLAEQVAQQAVKPTGGSARKGKSLEDRIAGAGSMEELEKLRGEIGVA